jgi:hypothetical protein
MAPDKTLLAVVTSELAVTKVSLYVGFDVLFATEFLVAVVKLANPLVVHWIWAFDILRDVVKGYVGLFNRCLDTRLQV